MPTHHAPTASQRELILLLELALNPGRPGTYWRRRAIRMSRDPETGERIAAILANRNAILLEALNAERILERYDFLGAALHWHLTGPAGPGNIDALFVALDQAIQAGVRAGTMTDDFEGAVELPVITPEALTRAALALSLDLEAFEVDAEDDLSS